MIPKVVASEIGSAQTLHVFACLQVDTADRPMQVRGCDITRDQARALKFTSGIWFAITDYHLVSKVRKRRG
jgi:hypothetical protein